MSTDIKPAPNVPAKIETRDVPVRWLEWARAFTGLFGFSRHRAMTKAAEEIRFRPNGFLTLGVEVELNLIDPVTGQLRNRGEEVLKAAAPLKKVKPEFCQDTVEINTGICQDAHAAAADLKATLASLRAICSELNLALLTTGIHPTADYHDSRLYDAPRYKENLERVRWLLRRTIAIGLHVHIGMNSPQDCIRYNNFFLHFLPHLLSLSASSPFWRGEDTGLFSSRPSAYEAIPTAGPPPPLQNWAEFEELYWSMKACGAIQSLKDLWWDARPSPRYGTLEIRVCDGVATLAETTAIVAFIHLLAHWFADNLDWLDAVSRPPNWVSRENKWRAMRYGLDAEIVTSANGTTKPVKQDIADWLKKLQPYVEQLGYRDYVHTLWQIVERGNSAMRQRTVFERTKDLNAVIHFNRRELEAGAPLWDEIERNKIATPKTDTPGLSLSPPVLPAAPSQPATTSTQAA